MIATGRSDTALRRLAELTDDPHLEALRRRLAEQRFRILMSKDARSTSAETVQRYRGATTYEWAFDHEKLAGEAKRGKSTLVNALIGRPLLPSGVTPLTALPVTVRHADTDTLTVTYRDGRTETRPAGDLNVVATESGNPDNRLEIADIVLGTPAPIVADGVELVDSPGTGTVHDRSSAAAVAAWDTIDATVLVLSADPPISASERSLLERVSARSMAVFCALNKTDRLDAGELAEVLDYTRTVLDDAAGHRVPIYPCVARAALDGGPPGVDASGVGALGAALRRYLDEHRNHDLQASIAAHGARLCDRLLDADLLTRRAAGTRDREQHARVDAFTTRLTQTGQRRDDAVDLARAHLARMLADLNTAAAVDSSLLAAQAADAVAQELDDAVPALSPAALEDQTRQAATAMITDLADTWRAGQHKRLAETLHVLDRRLAADLDAHLADLRGAARDLLGVDLRLPPPVDALLPEVKVSYVLDPDIGITVAWEAAIRRHLPGRYGRRRVRRHLLQETRRLTDRQIGRIRAGCQQALRDAQPAVLKAVYARYDAAVTGLSTALEAARDIAAAPDQIARLAALDTRIAALRAIRHDLGPATRG